MSNNKDQHAEDQNKSKNNNHQAEKKTKKDDITSSSSSEDECESTKYTSKHTSKDTSKHMTAINDENSRQNINQKPTSTEIKTQKPPRCGVVDDTNPNKINDCELLNVHMETKPPAQFANSISEEDKQKHIRKIKIDSPECYIKKSTM